MAIHKFTRHLERGEPIPVYGDGESARDYTFVDDAVAGTLAALDRCEGFEIYNLGGSKPVRLLDLVERLGEAVGRAPAVERRPAEPGDVPTTCAEVTKASSRLGWKAAIPLEEGLARFVAWYRRERAEGGVP